MNIKYLVMYNWAGKDDGQEINNFEWKKCLTRVG